LPNDIQVGGVRRRHFICAVHLVGEKFVCAIVKVDARVEADINAFKAVKSRLIIRMDPIQPAVNHVAGAWDDVCHASEDQLPAKQRDGSEGCGSGAPLAHGVEVQVRSVGKIQTGIVPMLRHMAHIMLKGISVKNFLYIKLCPIRAYPEHKVNSRAKYDHG
jgi:hypothetical protein